MVVKVTENGGYNMSRSYKKPFVKMANDVEFQKMANREFRRKTKNVLRGSADPEHHMPENNRKEGDCWEWPSEGVKLLVSDPKGIRK